MRQLKGIIAKLSRPRYPPHHDNFCSCSHRVGRATSRGQAKKLFTLKEHKEATKNIECRKGKGVLDEIPKALENARRFVGHTP